MVISFLHFHIFYFITLYYIIFIFIVFVFFFFLFHRVMFFNHVVYWIFLCLLIHSPFGYIPGINKYIYLTLADDASRFFVFRVTLLLLEKTTIYAIAREEHVLPHIAIFFVSSPEPTRGFQHFKKCTPSCSFAVEHFLSVSAEQSSFGGLVTVD